MAQKKTVLFTAYDSNGFSRIVFDSVRAPDDPGKDSKTKKPIAGKTALEVAREELAKPPPTKGGRRTVGEQQKARPTSAF